MSAYTTVPSTIAYANEEVTDPIYFEWHNHEYRLTYVRARCGDWMHGILLGRVKDLRNMSCWSCIPKALEECPMLQEDATLCTVASVTSAGVLADLYAPGIDPIVPVLTHHNAFVAWDAHRYHACALAVAHVVELHGMTRVRRREGGYPRPGESTRAECPWASYERHITLSGVMGRLRTRLPVAW